MVMDGMVQVECLISCTSKMYEMVHNFVWLEELIEHLYEWYNIFLEYSEHILSI
jgi:hypothetical protein